MDGCKIKIIAYAFEQLDMLQLHALHFLIKNVNIQANLLLVSRQNLKFNTGLKGTKFTSNLSQEPNVSWQPSLNFVPNYFS